jgi:hypothetical protein
MKEKKKNCADAGKEPYEKPRLRRIELAAEEVLATGCKMFPGDPGGVSGAGCTVVACSTTTGS